MLTPKLNKLLERVAEALDISPIDYERAVRSYNSVGKWLDDGYLKGYYPDSTKAPAIYPQGSINLGTIIRPVKDGKEVDFDVDLVCELQALKDYVIPEHIKHQVGNCLKDNTMYKDKLDPEGKRCWTLTYAESEGVGFHIDVLPCIPCPAEDHPVYQGAISITHKDEKTGKYDWKPGNPKGYAQWFKDRNIGFNKFAIGQKQRDRKSVV